MSTQANSTPETGSPILSAQQRQALLVLGYLFLRMGAFDRAAVVYQALAGQNPADREARRNLAYARLKLGDARAALDELRAAMDGGPLSTAQAALHLIRAQALWNLGRTDEARRAIDAYLALAGTPGNA